MSSAGFSWLDIPWDMVETVIEGRSAIDVPRLYVTSMADAEAFIDCYGYDLGDASHRKDIERLRIEAIEFIENDLLHDEPALAIHSVVREEADIRRLLLWASASQHDERQRWACSILRVMHTFAHCGSYFQEQYEDEIRAQILGRFQPHIHEINDGLYLGRGPDAIPLVKVELRGRKDRRSLAMKLLHKVENVAADIFDWVGLRFVTEERFDALLVSRYLRVNNLIMFAHVRPGRSRNTLLDLGRVREDMRFIDDEIRAGRMGEFERRATLQARAQNYPYPEPAVPSYNPYSAVAYHSMQFTCNQQIRVQNPHIAAITRVLTQPSHREYVRRFLERFGVQTEVRFLFPYEVQILDRRSFELTRSGLASHEDYKARQRYAVKRRLWGDRVQAEPPNLLSPPSGSPTPPMPDTTRAPRETPIDQPHATSISASASRKADEQQAH